MLMRGKAPLRISFCGGGTDVFPFPEEHGGIVLNCTIDKYAYATLSPRDDTKINIYSLDYDLLVRYDAMRELQFDGKLDLIKAVLTRMKQKRGFDLFLHCDAPPGTGMGASGAICVLLIGLLAKYYNLSFSNYEIAEMAFRVETEDLKLAGGRQDHYAATFGGFNLIEFNKDRTIVTPLKIDSQIMEELHYHLLLCYTQTSRCSGRLIDKQVRYYKNKRKETIEALFELKKLTYQMKDALMLGQLDELARLLHYAGELKNKMNPSTTTDYIDKLYKIALENGAVGGKILGAGGGGYLLLYCQFDKKHKISEKLEENGAKIVPFNFAYDGLRTWQTRKKDIADNLSL